MDGCPLGLGLVVEDKPTEFSCNYAKKKCMCFSVSIFKKNRHIEKKNGLNERKNR